MKPEKFHIIYMPKESYPNNRVRLNELFMKEFCKLGNRITWIFQSIENFTKSEVDIGNNHLVIYPRYTKFGAFGSFINRFYRLKKYNITKKKIIENKIDIILVGDGIIEGLIGLRLSSKYKIPFCFYLSSLFFDFDRNAYYENRKIKNFYKYIESFIKKPIFTFIIKRSDIFHPISNSMGKYYEKYQYEDRIVPLPICPGEDFIEFETTENIKNPSESFNIISTGAMGETRRMGSIFDVILKFKEKLPNSNVKFLFVGKIETNSYYEELKNEIREKGIGDIIEFIDQVPIDKIPFLLGRANIGMSIYPPILGFIVSSPTKLVEYLAVGLPVIGNEEIIEQKFIINESKGGIITKYDVNDIADKLIYAYENRDEIKKMGISGRKWIEKNRIYSIYAKNLQEKYAKIIKKVK